MAVVHQKMERLEARVTSGQKEVMQRAAALERTTLTDFVVRSAQKAAEESIQRHASIALSERESRAFVEALLNPPEPIAALRRAARHYRRTMAVAD